MNENAHMKTPDKDQSALVTLVDLALALAVEPNKDHTYASSTGTSNVDLSLQSENEISNAIDHSRQFLRQDDRDHTYSCRKTQTKQGRSPCICAPVNSYQDSRKSSSVENLNQTHDWQQLNIPKICDKKSNSLEKMHEQSSENLTQDLAQMTVLSKSLPDSAGIFFLGNIEKVSNQSDLMQQFCGAGNKLKTRSQLDTDRQCDHTYARAKAIKEAREPELLLSFTPATKNTVSNYPAYEKTHFSYDHTYDRTSSVNEKRKPFKLASGLTGLSQKNQIEQHVHSRTDHNYILKNNCNPISHSSETKTNCLSTEEPLQVSLLSSLINNNNTDGNSCSCASEKDTVSNWVQFCKDHTYSTLS